jgi:hypothetical protein
MTFNYFPYTPDDVKAMQNPAIQLYGNRLFSDQTVSELLSEFLLVVFSPKRTGHTVFATALPTREQLFAWNNAPLKYAPKARLNLKLFSFLGASRLESRHQTHRVHHEQLIQRLHGQIQVDDPEHKQDIIRTIENLFLGFQGAGSGRTWCAQSFLPISSGFLSGESIWKETKSEKDNMDDWYELIENRLSYFDMNQHLFFARGGELLYLQVCNALRQPHDRITAWCRDGVFGLTKDEQDPEWLHTQLNESLQNLMSFCPPTLTELAEFIDSRLDPITPKSTDGTESDRRFVSAGWCNTESWMEGYLFTVDLLRLMQSNLDVVERIYMLETACSMQVLRTLAMQSMRLMSGAEPCSGPDYRLAVSAPEENRPVIRRLSQQSVKAIEKMIFQSLRSDAVELPEDESERNKKLKQADRSYGSKLFVGLSKLLGFVVPKRGGGARFVLNEQLLRLLVVTTVPVGGRLTFDTFKELLERRHGLVFDAKGLDRASKRFCGKGIYLPADTDQWLQEMLEAAGFLIHLSDSCALIHNPADDRGDAQ